MTIIILLAAHWSLAALVQYFLMLGELFQNNHHRAPGRLNFAARRFEFDPTFAVLRLLARTGALGLRPAALEAS